MSEESDRKPVSPLTSAFIDDPDMIELVEAFVADLPARIDSIIAAVSAQSITDVGRLTHQLKGAAGGYGFPTLGEAARKIELTLMASSAPAAQTLSAIDGDIRVLLDLCYRAALSAPGASRPHPRS